MIHLSRGLKNQLRQVTIQTFANSTKVPNPFAHHDDHGDHDDHGHGDHGHGHGVPHGRGRPKVEYNTIT